MDFRPDIFVVDPERLRRFIVVDTRADGTEPPAVVSRLKEYMAHSNYPIGQLVTPNRFRMFRQSFDPFAPEAVEEIANFSTDRVLELPAADLSESDFENLFQRWLERLQARNIQVPSDLRAVIEENLLPYLGSSEIQAAHPREHTVAT